MSFLCDLDEVHKVHEDGKAQSSPWVCCIIIYWSFWTRWWLSSILQGLCREIWPNHSKGLYLKYIKVPRDVSLEEVTNVFGQVVYKNGYSYVHCQDPKLITKVEKLFMMFIKNLMSLLHESYKLEWQGTLYIRGKKNELGNLCWMDKCRTT